MSTTVTKNELVDRIAEQTSREPLIVRQIVQAVLDTISEYLKDGRRIELRNFGVFAVRNRKPRIGRNPNKPDQAIKIPVTPVPSFKPGRILKQLVKSSAKVQ